MKIAILSDSPKLCEYCKINLVKTKRNRFCSSSCSNHWHYKKGFGLGFQKGHGCFKGSEKGWFTKERTSGKKNINYTDGHRCGDGYPIEFKRMRKELLSKIVMCSVCKTFIFDYTPEKHLCVHHKDLNIQNNKLNNLVVLCNSCHHKLHRELEGLRR